MLLKKKNQLPPLLQHQLIAIGYFIDEKAEVRKFGKPDIDEVDQIDYMDVASNQIISISTSFIPFLEHDDAVQRLDGYKHATSGCALY